MVKMDNISSSEFVFSNTNKNLKSYYVSLSNSNNSLSFILCVNQNNLQNYILSHFLQNIIQN
jgi:hypothetical protein